MLAPGSRQNQSSGVPLLRQGYSQINIDGQQVTNNYIGIGDDQPRFSRDSIAEFEVITNRFDATQGRSAGMIANAITKSGTNNYSGGIGGYFRDDEAQRRRQGSERRAAVLRTSRSARRSADRSSRTACISSPTTSTSASRRCSCSPPTARSSAFNMNIPAPRTQYIWGIERRRRVLAEEPAVDPRQRLRPGLPVRRRRHVAPVHGRSTNQRFTKQTQGVWTTVLSNSMVNVVKAGYSNFNRNNHSLAGYKGGPNPDILGIPSFGWGAPPRVTFTGYSVGAVVQHHNQDLSSVRDDLTTSFDGARPPRHQDRRRVHLQPGEPRRLRQPLHAAADRAGRVGGQFGGAAARARSRCGTTRPRGT